MKDGYAVFEEGLQNMIGLAGESNPDGCSVVADDLARLSTLSDFRRGAFIAETLANVFSQVGDLFDDHVVSENDKKEIIGSMTQNLGALRSGYRGDKAGLYDILEDMQLTATTFEAKYSTADPAGDDPAPAGS